MAGRITISGVGLRWVFALLVVMASYNPAGYSYYHWAIQHLSEVTPLRVIAGIVLLIGWIIFIRATLRSLGGVGLLLVAALFGALLWLFIDIKWIPKDNIKVITYSGLVIISLILAVGMSWSHIRRHLSGQYDMDDVDQED